MPNIERFVKAQRGEVGYPSYEKAYAEIEQGEKTGHWIWYILPQIKGLGSSVPAKTYAIADIEEACEYLQNKELFHNYYKLIALILKKLDEVPAALLMGRHGDEYKLISSLTLFQNAALLLQQQGDKSGDYEQLSLCCLEVLGKLGMQGYSHCETTLQILETSEQPDTAATLPTKPARAIGLTLFSQEPVSKSSGVDPYVPKEEVGKNPSLEIKVVESAEKPATDFSQLSTALGQYIEERNKEWSFHYNFLGIVSFIYWLQDAIHGTDYLNSKSKEIKINAATHLKHIIDSGNVAAAELTHAEKSALNEGRLGTMLSFYGGHEKILETIVSENPESNLDCFLS